MNSSSKWVLEAQCLVIPDGYVHVGYIDRHFDSSEAATSFRDSIKDSLGLRFVVRPHEGVCTKIDYLREVRPGQRDELQRLSKLSSSIYSQSELQTALDSVCGLRETSNPLFGKSDIVQELVNMGANPTRMHLLWSIHNGLHQVSLELLATRTYNRSEKIEALIEAARSCNIPVLTHLAKTERWDNNTLCEAMRVGIVHVNVAVVLRDYMNI